MGGGILKNNNIVGSQNYNSLSLSLILKTIENKKNIKNQANIKTPKYIRILRNSRIINSHKIINILNETVVSNNQKDMKNQKVLKLSKYINSFAFSLIELSIVLIIIGLLVAGVTGGASLIRSAKIRAFMNELGGWKQAVNSFYASKDRLPGDLNNLGVIGHGSGQTYTTSSFPSPYIKTAPNVYSAPFIDLYLENIIDFKPDPDNINVNGKGIPYSKIYKDSYYIFRIYASAESGCIENIKINSPYLYLELPLSDRPNTALTFKTIDQKIDDGFFNSGSIRGRCYSSKNGWNVNYDETINDKNNKEQCNVLLYHMGF